MLSSFQPAAAQALYSSPFRLDCFPADAWFAAMKPQEVTEALQLNKLKDKVWFVVPSCATTGEGLLEGLAWLSNNVKAQPSAAAAAAPPPKK